ncbi:hypothetical protein P7K49_004111 [Saguinus oedipus]|uniref:VWFD domain-containing protein n=1 Tax=Saguinus oedipus TaxID=9490 RepID=A0ABQ9W753_SAGOE|nr:hypothetical protein P7K49_004111 [Saguinus oedipus]
MENEKRGWSGAGPLRLEQGDIWAEDRLYAQRIKVLPVLPPTSPASSTVPSETTGLTENPTISTQKPTVSTEKPTVPKETPTIPTEKPSIPTKEPSIPTEKPTISTEKPTVPTEEPSTPTEKTTISTEESAIPTEKPSVPTEKPTIPTEEATTSIEETTISTKEPTTPTEKPTIPTEKPIISTEKPIIPTEETTIPTEETTVPTEKPTVPTEIPTIPTETITVPTENLHVSTVGPTTPTEETTTSTEESTIPTEETTVPTEKPTVPTEETTVPTEKPTIPTEKLTALMPHHPSPTAIGPATSLMSSNAPGAPVASVILGTTTTPRPTPGMRWTERWPRLIETVIRREWERDASGRKLGASGYLRGQLKQSIVTSEEMGRTAQSERDGSVGSAAPQMLTTNPVLVLLRARARGLAAGPSVRGAVSATQAFCSLTTTASRPLPAVASTTTTTMSPNCTERCRCWPGSRVECQISQCGTHTVCQLKNGQYGCHPYAGTATCLVYGDPHYVTFDGRHFGFTGRCTYILAQPCGNSTDPFFRVTAKNKEQGLEGVSCLSKVYVTLPKTTVTLLKGRRTLVGGQQVTLPAIPSKGVFLGASGRFVELQTEFGLRVRWDGDQQLYVTVSSTYSGKLCGLCGNYDGNSGNDNLKSDGSPTADKEELGNSWEMDEDEDQE